MSKVSTMAEMHLICRSMRDYMAGKRRVSEKAGRD